MHACDESDDPVSYRDPPSNLRVTRMSSSGPHGHVQAAHEKTTVSPPRGTGKRAPPAGRSVRTVRCVRRLRNAGRKALPRCAVVAPSARVIASHVAGQIERQCFWCSNATCTNGLVRPVLDRLPYVDRNSALVWRHRRPIALNSGTHPMLQATPLAVARMPACHVPGAAVRPLQRASSLASVQGPLWRF
jgi:hypothetical protein